MENGAAVSRRNFLLAGGAIGLAVAVTSQSSHVSASELSDAPEGATALVTSDSAAETGFVEADVEGTIRTVPVAGFPSDWNFLVGDQIYWVQEEDVGIPLVRTEFDESHVRFIALNQDPALCREIAAY